MKRTILALLSLACALAACDVRKDADPYDPAKMDFKPPPAVVTTDRHTGPFAAGDSLSLDAMLKPLTSAAVKEVRLDTVHKIIEIAPGVRFSAWTFGDRVPGPTVRARVGDKIRFTMTNRSDETVPGVQLTSAPMMHSMDFHAAMVSPVDKYSLGTLTLNVMAMTWTLKARLDPSRGRATASATALIGVATLTRVLASVDVYGRSTWLIVASICWSSAFALLLIRLARIRAYRK